MARSSPWLFFAALAVLVVALLFLWAPISAAADPLSNATGWLGPPASISGQKTLVYFWSLSCERCRDGMAFLVPLAQAPGLSVIGVHAPEYIIERSKDAAKRASQQLNWTLPLAMDHNQTIWASLSRNNNQSTVYLFDESGRLVHAAFALTPGLSDAVLRWQAGLEPRWPAPSSAPAHRIHMGYHAAPPEVHAAWKPFASQTYFFPGKPALFVPYLYGSWYVGSDFARADAPAKVWLSVSGVSNVSVLAYSPSEAATVRLDGVPVDARHAGAGLFAQERQYRLDASSFGLFQVAANLSGGHDVVLDVPAGFVLYRFTVDAG